MVGTATFLYPNAPKVNKFSVSLGRQVCSLVSCHSHQVTRHQK